MTQQKRLESKARILQRHGAETELDGDTLIARIPVATEDNPNATGYDMRDVTDWTIEQMRNWVVGHFG